jgi:hypothetical protein
MGASVATHHSRIEREWSIGPEPGQQGAEEFQGDEAPMTVFGIDVPLLGVRFARLQCSPNVHQHRQLQPPPQRIAARAIHDRSQPSAMWRETTTHAHPHCRAQYRDRCQMIPMNSAILQT